MFSLWYLQHVRHVRVFRESRTQTTMNLSFKMRWIAWQQPAQPAQPVSSLTAMSNNQPIQGLWDVDLNHVGIKTPSTLARPWKVHPGDMLRSNLKMWSCVEVAIPKIARSTYLFWLLCGRLGHSHGLYISHLISMIRNVLCGPHEHVANFKAVCRGKHVAMSQKWDTREPKRLVIFNRQSHVWANLNHMPCIKLYFSLWFKMLPILQNTVLEFIGFNTLWDVPLRVSLCGICWPLLTSRWLCKVLSSEKTRVYSHLALPLGSWESKLRSAFSWNKLKWSAF